MTKNRYNNPRRTFRAIERTFKAPEGMVTLEEMPDSVAAWHCPKCGWTVYSDRRLLDALNYMQQIAQDAQTSLLRAGPRCKPCDRLMKMELIHVKRQVGVASIEAAGRFSVGYVIKGGALLYICQKDLSGEDAAALMVALVSDHERMQEFVRHAIETLPYPGY